jgi:hypothetical protein
MLRATRPKDRPQGKPHGKGGSAFSSLSSTLKKPKTSKGFRRLRSGNAVPKGEGKLKSPERFLQGGFRKKVRNRLN